MLINAEYAIRLCYCHCRTCIAAQSMCAFGGGACHHHVFIQTNVSYHLHHAARTAFNAVDDHVRGLKIDRQAL